MYTFVVIFLPCIEAISLQSYVERKTNLKISSKVTKKNKCF